MSTRTPFELRVALLGCPAHPLGQWTERNLNRLRDLGFNAAQLNIAWGYRPADEPLNLEDVVRLPDHLEPTLGQPLALRSDPAPDAFDRRRADLRGRAHLARNAGLRTIFHFGAPYNGFEGFVDRPLPNCLLDGRTPERYVRLLEVFARDFPDVDDLLLYTFDQDAWICDEYGTCQRCRGLPLHERVVPFVNLLARTWRRLTPHGRLWWEPWELSAGQALRAVEDLDADTAGLALHSNVAEVMIALPVDRFVKNAAALAHERGLPVILEGFLGAPSEELEPFRSVPSPLATLRQLRAFHATHGVTSVKEYFGLLPDQDDVNLDATGLFLHDPHVSDDDALTRLADTRGPRELADYWRLTSRAVELFPWDASWYIREVGRADPAHGLDAAFIRGQQVHTPAWESTRRATFMQTSDEQPDPWLLEDVALRLDLTERTLARALTLGRTLAPKVHPHARDAFDRGLDELHAWRLRCRAYAHHLHETNLTHALRLTRDRGEPLSADLLARLKATLEADLHDQDDHPELRRALDLLTRDPHGFLDTYFRVRPDNPRDKGPFTVTTR
ncbi:hypothetical protein [Deinococcus pimensis]|uniref:hypothetical protein n=1 Tax=Deinococcus pimensis TaxID=309888 RepID=UPI0004BCB8A1|nr:hypothetical protein [Deinococcus pimensis]